MPSSYTANNGIEKPATGEQSGTWGTTVDNDFDLFDAAICGNVSITLSGTTATLDTPNGSSGNGRNAVIVFTGSPSGTVTVTVTPNTAKKVYFIKNTSTQSVVITQGSGATVTIASGQADVVYCDGAGATAAVNRAIPLNADQISNGATNQFFSNALVRGALSGTSPVTYNSTTGAVGIQTANGSQAGALASADWTTFNGKEPAITSGTTTQYWRGDKTFHQVQVSDIAGTGAATNNVMMWNGVSWQPSSNVLVGQVSVGTTGTPYVLTVAPAGIGSGVGVGWNKASGRGETDFYNYGQAGVGGFSFWNYGLNGSAYPTTGSTSLLSIIAQVSGSRVGIGTDNPIHVLELFTGAFCDSTWTNASSVDLKTDFEPVSHDAVLSAIDALPVESWRYKEDPEGVRRIGPTSQDWVKHLAGIVSGVNDQSIGTVEEIGVCISAIKALSAKVLALEEALSKKDAD